MGEPAIYDETAGSFFSPAVIAMDLDVEEEKFPKLIVFDLDYTLWPFYVDCHVMPPFSKTRSGFVVDKYGYQIQLYEDVMAVLQWLQNKAVKLALASRTQAPAAGIELIQILNIEKYFEYKEIYPGCKLNHFKKFTQNSGIPFTEMLFFDDEDRNIRDIKSLGVTCLHVPNGITMALVKKGIELYTKKGYKMIDLFWLHHPQK